MRIELEEMEVENRVEPDVEEVKARGLQRSSPELEPAITPLVTETSVECPICQGSFPVTEIEMHAAYCNGEEAITDRRRPRGDSCQGDTHDDTQSVLHVLGFNIKWIFSYLGRINVKSPHISERLKNLYLTFCFFDCINLLLRYILDVNIVLLLQYIDKVTCYLLVTLHITGCKSSILLNECVFNRILYI